MTLGLVALILPRMELDHLREWILHHRQIGVDRFFLYNNGHLSHDPVFRKGESDRVWAKKPEANYHLELSDEEIDRRIGDIVSECGETVRHIPWAPESGHGRSFRDCQKSAINHELLRQKKLREVDWLGHLDIDELLVCPRGNLRQLVNRLPLNVAAIRLRQKLFTSRWNAGCGIPYAKLTTSFGVLGFNRKFIVRVEAANGWKGPHQILGHDGKIWDAATDVLRFHHFRGREHHGIPAPDGWGIRQYTQISDGSKEFDDAHCEPTRQFSSTVELKLPGADSN